MSGSGCNTASGLLVTSDSATIVFLEVLNEQAQKKFILKRLDANNLFIRSELSSFVNKALQSRLDATVFEEDVPAEEE
jgi:ribosome-binding factor A